MSLANCLTALRIVLAPISVLFLFWHVPHQDLIAAGFFGLAGLTDGLDGWAARVRKQSTQFGKSFDPFADKVLVSSALFSLAKLGRVSWWIVWVIVIREVVVTIMRQFASKQGQSIGASYLGKAKTLCQIVAVTWLILWPVSALPLLWVALILSVVSGLDYMVRWRGAFRRRSERPSISG